MIQQPRVSQNAVQNYGDVFARDRLIFSAQLSMSHKFYLITLDRFLGNNTKAWPAQSTIAFRMSANVRSVKNWQAELIKKGILKVDSGKGCRNSNTYVICLDTLSRMLKPNREPHSPLEASNGEPHSPQWCTTFPSRVNDVPTKDIERHIKKDSLFPAQETSDEPTSKTDKSNANPPELLEFCKVWNSWHDAGIVRRRIQNPESLGEELRNDWKRGWTNDP